MAASDFSPTSALIGAVSSLAGNVLNYGAQREQREFDKRFWYEQQQYNSPKNQVARLRQAGLNPSLAMQNGAIDSGNISSLPNAHEPPQYDFSPIAAGLQNDLALEQQRRLNDAEIDSKHALTENQRIKNNHENSRQILELFKLLNEGNLSKVDADKVRKEIDYRQKQIDWYDKDVESTIGLRNAQRDAADAKSEYQKILTRFAPRQQEIITRNLVKQGNAIDAAVRKDDAEAAYAAANEALAKARKEGVDIDNDVADSIADSLVDEAYYKADEQYWKAIESGNVANSDIVMGSRVRHGQGSALNEKYVRPSTSRRRSKRERSLK